MNLQYDDGGWRGSGKACESAKCVSILHEMFQFRVSRGNLTKYLYNINYINILLSFPEIPETETSRAISTHTSHFHTPSHFLSNHHHPTVSSSIPFALCNVECKLSYGVQRMPRRVSKDTNMI